MIRFRVFQGLRACSRAVSGFKCTASLVAITDNYTLLNFVRYLIKRLGCPTQTITQCSKPHKWGSEKSKFVIGAPLECKICHWFTLAFVTHTPASKLFINMVVGDNVH